MLDLFERRCGHPALDDAFAAQVDVLRSSVPADLDSDPWDHGGPDVGRVSDR